MSSADVDLDMRRCGRFVVPAVFLETMPPQLRHLIFGGAFVVDVRYDPHADTYEYAAISPLFDPVPDDFCFRGGYHHTPPAVLYDGGRESIPLYDIHVTYDGPNGAIGVHVVRTRQKG